MTIKYAIKHQVLHKTGEMRPTIELSSNLVYLSLEFDAEWDGATVTVVFENSSLPDAEGVARLWTGDAVEVPPEVLVNGDLRIGCIGLKADGIRLTTERMRSGIYICRAGGAMLLANGAAEMTPELWEQCIAAAGAANEAAKDATAAKDDLLAARDSGEFDGKDGKNATIEIGTVETADEDVEASVINSGTDTAAVLNFVLPRGKQGQEGPAGKNGTSPAIYLSRVEENGRTGVQISAINDGSDAPQTMVVYDGENGEPGEAGQDGSDGGYYSPAVTQPDANTMRVSFTPSKADMPAVQDTDITIPSGGSGSVAVDSTLTVSGQAADAKAVGDAISNLSEEIANIPSGAADIGFKIIAHRGWHEVAAQNTIPAFVAAVNHGFKWLEIDIRKCSDGIYVMSHDDAVTLYNSGTSISVTISSSAYSDIKNYTWDAAGEYKLCTLQAVFNTMKAYDVCMICDRKTGENSEIMELAALCGATDKVMLSYGSFSAAYGERTLLNKYDNTPIRCVPSDYENYKTLAAAISNPIFADVNASSTIHYQKYLNIALSCGVPILFSGCELTNANRWQVLAAGCMANSEINISYADFYNAIANNYDAAADISISNENIAVGVGDAIEVTAESSLQSVGGYIYAYSEKPTIATVSQTAFGSAATITVTGVALGATNVVFFCGNGEIKKLHVTVSEAGVTTYTVTNNLTNASNSNTALTANEGAAYTATISANAGYELDKVTVTMGGVDVTADVYNDGIINISSVIGNIVITATTTENSATVYTVTNALTNVTSSNSATSVEENASYNAILTAADGYEISAVTVTMGGTDVTSTVYADGEVAIPAVTGNIVITATAEAAQFEPVTVEAQYYIGGSITVMAANTNLNTRMFAYVTEGTQAFSNCGNDKYPIPIPDGASSVTITCAGFIPGIQILQNGTRIADPGWTVLGGTTHDLTQYDGATHIAVNFKSEPEDIIPTDIDTSGFSIVFE